MIQLIPATEEHARLIEVYQPGVEALWEGKTKEQVIQGLMKKSEESWSWMIDNEVGCMFGVQNENLLAGASLWLMSTKLMRKNKVSFLKTCLELKRPFLDKYPVITGYCNIGYKVSERWLRWLGADFDPPVNHAGLELSRFHFYR